MWKNCKSSLMLLWGLCSPPYKAQTRGVRWHVFARLSERPAQVDNKEWAVKL